MALISQNNNFYCSQNKPTQWKRNYAFTIKMMIKRTTKLLTKIVVKLKIIYQKTLITFDSKIKTFLIDILSPSSRSKVFSIIKIVAHKFWRVCSFFSSDKNGHELIKENYFS
jgi:hypothetical protein